MKPALHTRVLRWLRPEFASGPRTARAFHALLALVFLAAWASLGVQVLGLVGARGLEPAAPWIAAQRGAGIPLREWPTLFALGASDGALRAGVYVGVALALCALAGVAVRACLATSALLYLSYCTVGGDFLAFQWDSMLVECGLLAALLPRDRPAPWAHALFRVLLFKLYFESGLAKWGSHLHDWHDGSAMRFYFETAPIPTRLALWAHATPRLWHAMESRAVLVLELALPLLIFSRRLGRRVAFVAFTAFQVVNASTANYGFFCYLSGALHVFVLDDRDLERASAWLALRVPSPARRTFAGAATWWQDARARAAAPFRALREAFSLRLSARRARTDAVDAAADEFRDALSRIRPPLGPIVRRYAAAGVLAAYALVSVLDGVATFAQPGPWGEAVEPLARVFRPFRAVNTYHLFAHITRRRIEPEVQTLEGADWVAHDLRYKPGDARRAPPFVAPHQPRLDFRLWFFGLSYPRRIPAYVPALLERVCRDPDAVAGFFAAPLPRAPRAVRLAFWEYHLVSPAEHRRTGSYWRRELLGTTRALPCDEATSR